MQYWKYVEVGDYKTYTRKLLTIYLRERSIDLNAYPFWNPIPLSLIEDKIPELVDGFSAFGKINQVALLVLNYDSSTLHIDHTIGKNAGVKARINVPVLNTEGSRTAFFEMTEEQYKNHTVNSGGTRAWPLEYRKTLIPVTEVVVDRPTILRTSSPHTVYCDKNVFPRITLTVSMVDDVVKYLDTL